MIWVRRTIVALLSLILLFALVSEASAVSGKINLSNPQKLETWLAQSNFYHSIVANSLKNAQLSASNDQGAGRISLNDAAVQQTVNSIFTPAVLQSYANTIIDGNYAWLQGKTPTPVFTVDLRPAKQKLAEQINQVVKDRVASLPACTPEQLAQLQSTLNTDPLSVPCKLPTMDPETAGKQAAFQISSSESFLNNPVITANTINPNGKTSGKPYYKQLSSLPKAYTWSQRAPWILGGIALLCTLGILFIAPRKRFGLRRLGIVLVIAGIILIIIKFLYDATFNKVEDHVFNNANVGEIQKSLTDFSHHVEAQLVRIDLWFGIAFVLIGSIILIVLWATRPKPPTKLQGPKPGDTIKPSDNKPVSNQSAPPPTRPVSGSPTPAPTVPSQRPPLPVLKSQPRPRPPRLIQ
ncbi:MAG TPA: hypothetical protein VLF79_01280 [Candidatus Saccharimonadales bacterium]|nr:hypothetical protein [Candidatus Saccharimonadales bacterium]